MINRVAGRLLVVAATYFTWYGIYELRIQDDPTADGGPVDVVTGWSGDISVSDLRSFGPHPLRAGAGHRRVRRRALRAAGARRRPRRRRVGRPGPAG